MQAERNPQPAPVGNGRLLKSREAAELLSVSERTLWSLANRGEISRVLIGRSVRYDPKDLREYIAARKNSAPTTA